MVYHITGASGYFAGNFIYHNKDFLKSVGCVLYDLKNLPPKLKDFEDSFIKGDINETLESFTCFKPGDILINFASYSHVDYSFTRPALVRLNNCNIGNTIREIAKKNPFLYIIHISTDEIYTCSSPYSESKYEQEKKIRTIKSDRVVILRFNNLYGNNSEFPIIQKQPCLIPNTIKKRSIIKQGNTETNTRNFTHISDAVNYVKNHAERIQTNKFVFRIYEMYYGRVYTVAQIHEMLKSLFVKYGINYKIIEIPDREKNDAEYPSSGKFDESEETFKYHLEETFNYILNN